MVVVFAPTSVNHIVGGGLLRSPFVFRLAPGFLLAVALFLGVLLPALLLAGLVFPDPLSFGLLALLQSRQPLGRSARFSGVTVPAGYPSRS